MIKNFSLIEVKKLVKNAYEVGLCDGIDKAKDDIPIYKDSNDFWKKNKTDWENKKINYVI